MQKQRWSFPPSARPARTVVKLLLLGLLVMLVPAGALIAASQNAKPGITLQISPASQSIERAKTASYVVTATSTGGFSGAVSLSASGLPAGSSAAFSPSSVTLSPGSPGSPGTTATATMNVSTSQSTPIGTYSLGIKGSSGKVSGTVSAGLTINYPISSSFSMSATPASVTMPPGSIGVYSIQLSRNNFAGPVNLSVMGGLPSGSTPAFAPNPATGNSSTLEIATASNAPNGTYTLYLVGSGPDANGKTQYAYASAQLVIDSTLRNFTLSGNLARQLAPGTSVPLDLGITNPNNKTLGVTNLSVSIKSVTRTADAIARNLPCGTGDYTVTQYSGPYPLTVQPGSSTSLSGLRIESTQWPQFRMLDTPANQDGCKGATLQLVYSGSGQGN
ncbi:hypothetical protein NG701_20565 [Pseudarthrobacter sp. HLT3-5]|uniref:COG1470 family protein n=1 Tax=Pseudarthrobacter cellobiosi TaxID=2953654 RepID=UPI00208F5927|nr:hypothetical protein [Pseudarthrobacter sp. HLT3-5]MCO4276778.1 hypothetical protein [Pseudarthrobacter sp. HLT3-5]